MKTLTCTASLLAVVGLVLAGCSDEAQSPVAPQDQPAQVSAPLAKGFAIKISGADYPIPPYVLDPGEVRVIGQNLTMRGLKMKERWQSTSDLMDGEWINEVNSVNDLATGEGTVYGTVTITPYKDVGGGVWRGVYYGQNVQSGTPGIWKCTLKGFGQGVGGTIQGMKYTLDGVLDVYGFNPTKGWYGTHRGILLTYQPQ